MLNFNSLIYTLELTQHKATVPNISSYLTLPPGVMSLCASSSVDSSRVPCLTTTTKSPCTSLSFSTTQGGQSSLAYATAMLELRSGSQDALLNTPPRQAYHVECPPWTEYFQKTRISVLFTCAARACGRPFR